MTNISEIEAFIQNNRDEFLSNLLAEAGNVTEKIDAILAEGDINLPKNAGYIALYVLGNNREDLISFAEKEGVSWAKHSLTLSFKLEWVHAIRRTLWQLLRQHHVLNASSDSVGYFYEMEKKINDGIDQFLNTFFISYSKYKDQLIMNQRKLVEHLTVPIIPVGSGIAVLPLIDELDSYRMNIIEDKVLNEIAKLGIETLMIDLSGIPDLDEHIVSIFQKVLNGIKMMGSKTVLTGIRPQLAKKISSLGMEGKLHIEVKGTLQKALNEYLVEESVRK